MATESPARPVVRRRREVSHASARSLLMTLLGEFVLPHEQPVWTSVLVETLALFGVEEKSSRQALARASSEGWVRSHRAGRRVRWTLTPQGRTLLAESARRVHEFGAGERDWDGRWLVLLVSVPESKRDLRHRLRTELTWAGFGSPEPGVWISPHASAEAGAREVVRTLGLADAMSFVGTYGSVGDEAAVAARAWDLTELGRRYECLLAEFGPLDPADGDATLLAHTRLVHEWRRFPYLDPRLPAPLLPPDWSGTAAAELFHTRRARWRPGAQRRWNQRLTGG